MGTDGRRYVKHFLLGRKAREFERLLHTHAHANDENTTSRMTAVIGLSLLQCKHALSCAGKQAHVPAKTWRDRSRDHSQPRPAPAQRSVMHFAVRPGMPSRG